MTEDVFGLRYAFVYRHGHVMELYREDGLQVEALSSLQVRMLEANQIPRMLPLAIHEEDLRVKLMYSLSATRMLSHVLKVEPFGIQQLAKLMFAVVCALEDSKNYMLVEANYILKDNFIFIGQDWSDVFLTYVPIEKHFEEDEVCKSVEKLLAKLVMNLNEEERTSIQGWQAAVFAQNHSISGFKTALLKLMDETSKSLKLESLEAATPQQHLNKPLGLLPSVSNLDQQQTPEISDEVKTETGLPKALWRRENKQPQLPSDQHVKPLPSKSNRSISFKPLDSRSRWITLAIFIVSSAYLWQQYASMPSTSTLQIVTGITLLIGDAVFIVLLQGRPVLSEKEETEVDSRPNYLGLQTNAAMAAPVSHRAMKMEQYYESLPNHTTLLRPHKTNATVFLGQSNPQPVGPRIELLNEGSNRSVLIQDDLFTIGRSDENVQVDLILEEAGVSRIHAEIIRFGVTFQIRDAGSTNGTYLNEEQLAIYQAYPLNDGDCIRILRHEMRFRIADK